MRSWLLLLTMLILMLHEAQGRNRKLMTKTSFPISGLDTMFKNDHQNNEGNGNYHPKSKGNSRSDQKISGKEKNLSTNSSPVTGKQQLAPEPYPDILDLAGMDYSQAMRKPPIHN